MALAFPSQEAGLAKEAEAADMKFALSTPD
jgi:hypothetical protein